METIAYDIDPDGDAEVVLKGTINTQKIIPYIDGDIRDTAYDGKDDAFFDNPSLAGRYAVFKVGEADTGESGTETEVRMRVSSRHLVLASRVFRAMFEGPWNENNPSVSDSGRPQIMAVGWDPAAFAIVLDAIHGRYNDIPENVNIGLLVRIAVIIDYYALHECLRHITNVWMNNLQGTYKIPQTFCKSSFMWLSVSWVFSRQDVVSPVSRVLLKHTKDFSSIRLGDIPLYQTLERIDATRQEIIGRLVAGLNELREKLLKERVCPANNTHCPILMLGSLLRKQKRLGILDTPPLPPYSGHSISSLIAEIVQPMVPPTVHHGYQYQYSTPNICSCTFKSRLKDIFDGIEKDISKYSLT